LTCVNILLFPFALIVMFIVGGKRTVAGAVVGAALVTLVQEQVRQYEDRSVDLGVLTVHRLTGLTQLVLVLMILLVMYARPEGIVGRLSMARDTHPASEHVADLGLMVASGYRRMGIGRALLDAAVDWARGAGIRKLELHVFPHNAPAIALYESYGFVREGYRKAHYRRGDEYVDAILMAYEVA